MPEQATHAAPTSLIVVEVTLLYPHLFEKHKIPGSAEEPKYGTVLLLPLGMDMKPLQLVMVNAAKAKFGPDAMNLIQAGKVKLPFRKQAEKAAEGKSGYSEDPQALYLNVNSDRQPGVVDQRRQPVIDPAKVYGGVVANVQINAYGWQHPLSGRGLSFSLQNVQVVRDGPRLGNENPDPTKVFGDVDMPEGGGAPRTGSQVEADLKSLFE